MFAAQTSSKYILLIIIFIALIATNLID